MKRILLAMVMCLVPLAAQAGLIVDFSLGPTGNLGTTSLVQGTIKVEANGTLYRHSGYECCDHIDHGLGVLQEWETPNPAEAEINNVDLIRLTLPSDLGWDKIYFSSVNNRAYGAVYANIYPVGPGYTFAAGEGNFLGADEGFVQIAEKDRYAPFLWIKPLVPSKDNYFLLWKLDMHKGGPTPDPVPEPTTLLTLGVGLLYSVKRFRG